MNLYRTIPVFECFDFGIVRSLQLYIDNYWVPKPPHSNLVMGIASVMPADEHWLPLLVDYLPEGSALQSMVIGRSEIWNVHRKTAELGGHLRSDVEDNFYLPSGDRCIGNGQLIETLTKYSLEIGRRIATPSENRTLLGIT